MSRLVRGFVRALPDVVRALARVVTDPALPRAVKLVLAAALVYLLSPVDLIPDFVPVIGWIDDVMIGAVVVDGVLSFVDRRLVLRYWPGSPRSLDRVARVARLLAVWVPRRLKQRVFAPGRVVRRELVEAGQASRAHSRLPSARSRPGRSGTAR